jgi:hypothetical protein
MLNQIKLAKSIEQPVVHVSTYFLCNYFDFANYLNWKLRRESLEISYDLTYDYGRLETSIAITQNIKIMVLKNETEMFLRARI